MTRILFFICFLIAFANNVLSQDIIGSYIRTARIPNTNTFTPIYEYSFTLTLLTNPLIVVSRPTVNVSFGDNSSGSLSLASTFVVNGAAIKTYTGTHIYPGPTPGADYAVEYQDTFRVAGIKNILASQTQSCYARSLIVADQFFGSRPSGTVTNFPPILGIDGNNIMYDPMFIRGSSMDSVSYSLFNYFNAGGYYIPNGAAISPTLGILTFPRDSIGLYTFNIKIIEWGKDASGVRRPSRTTYVDLTLDITTTVGIHKQEMKNIYKLFPNPFTNKLSVDFSQVASLPEKISIINTVGQKVFEKSEIQSTMEIDLTSLPNGVYYVFIQDNGAIKRPLKVIKSHNK